MARRQYPLARAMLSSRSCNTGGKPPSWRELLPLPGGRRPAGLKRYLRSLFDGAALHTIRRAAKSRPGSDFGRTIDAITNLVRSLDVTPPISDYSSYYDEKKEAHSLADPASFLPKQKAVHGILAEKQPRSVLDLGANTGWYSVLAASLGASVIALEEDESCVDILYGRAKRQGLAILALKGSFADLTAEIHPMYRAGAERLGADLVLVLGLVHHLVLGEGRSIEDVFDVLAKLATKTLVLEFVSLDDEKVRESPDFFPNLRKQSPVTYNLEKILEAGRRHFRSAEVRASNPATRTILVFDK
jgi:SAM-dependent methyltransferase